MADAAPDVPRALASGSISLLVHFNFGFGSVVRVSRMAPSTMPIALMSFKMPPESMSKLEVWHARTGGRKLGLEPSVPTSP